MARAGTSVILIDSMTMRIGWCLCPYPKSLHARLRLSAQQSVRLTARPHVERFACGETKLCVWITALSLPHAYGTDNDLIAASVALATQALWGDYAYQPKTKRIVRMKGKADAKPLFVQLALEPLWKAYAAVEPEADSKVFLNCLCHRGSVPFSSACFGTGMQGAYCLVSDV